MRIVILGSGSFAREVYDWVGQSGNEVIGFFSGVVDNQKKELRGLPIFYDATTIPTDAEWVVGSGNTKAMQDMIKKIGDLIKPTKAIVHPSCTIGSNVQLGKGSIVCPGSILTCDIKVGSSVAINLSCTIGHDSTIGDCVHLSPNVSLSGGTQVGSNCEFGTGAISLPNTSIPANCIIGAGAVITKNLSASGTYIGMPAKQLMR